MVHPLEQTLDTSLHEQIRKPVQRRRSSLDNSCLSADHSLLQILPVDHGENYETNRPRRFSLTHKFTTTATFLADPDFTKNNGSKHSDLDLDCHDSKHESSTRKPVMRSASSSRRAELGLHDNDDDNNDSSQEELTAEEVFSTSVDDDDSSDYDSDCDSFCDASVQEQANKEYIITDLGASCFFGPEAHFYDMSGDFEKYSDPSSVDQQLMELDDRLTRGGKNPPRRTRSGRSGGCTGSSNGSVDLGPSPEEGEEEEEEEDSDNVDGHTAEQASSPRELNTTEAVDVSGS